jgi:hypothetical protein
VPKVKKGAAVTGGRGVKATGKATKVTKRGTKVAAASSPRSAKARAVTTKKPGRAAKVASAKKKAASPPRRKAVARVGSTRGAVKRKGAKRASAPASKLARSRKVRVVAAPVVRVAIKALDPYRKCGPGTSVQHLYRVDEQVDGRTTHHLVFFDRHGWYCEHGRACPAVAHARKYNG